MPRKEFLETEHLKYFLDRLTKFSKMPYDELVAGYETYLKKKKNWLKGLHNALQMTYIDIYDKRYLTETCAYKYAIIMMNPENPVSLERIVEGYKADYAELNGIRNATNNESAFSDEGWKMIDNSCALSGERNYGVGPEDRIRLKTTIVQEYASDPDGWIDDEIFGEEYEAVLGTLDDGEMEVLKIRMKNPKMKQKDMANEIGITDSGVSRRMKKIKKKFEHLKRKPRRPKKKKGHQ